jgi:hypothetical protein
MTRIAALVVAALVTAALAPSRAAAGQAETPVIVSPEGASYAEVLAAKEVRRYVYLRTGELLTLVASNSVAPDWADMIVVAAKGRPIVAAADTAAATASGDLEPQEYLLKTVRKGDHRRLIIAGGDGLATLYGAYRFAEHLGVRFYLHGDVVPDARRPVEVPTVDERAKPLFELRGIQPFHDFPEGPDWWNADDYKAVISQLVKLRMNFLGLHTYPEGGPNAEPTVWIGPPDDIAEGGNVKASYPSSYQNTLRGNWGYQRKKTSDFSLGAADLFERDAFGADVMTEMCPQPQAPEQCNKLFDLTAEMLREAFTHARALGVKTCVGTETPLTVPAAVRERLKKAGKDPKDPAVLRELYEGIFRRIAAAYPIDYYWFWTPEGWTWGGAKPEQVKATLDDIAAAVAAAKKTGAAFRLATCGWVLGPQNDRALFDKTFPKDMAISCINRQVGKDPVEPGFANVKGRGKWAIPWMEDDPNLLAPQLWAGRMRKDAADALKYGCTGLMGIHWRTRVLGPNVSALARAAWDQSGWGTPAAAETPAEPARKEGPEGGQAAAFPANTIAGAEDPALYQTVRYDVSAYHFAMPNGRYTVVLRFCEPHYKEAGKRIFGVKIQGKQVIDGLDVFAKVGQNKALDYTYPDVEVKNGWLDIDFVHEVEFPCIAAISVEGPGGKKKVNCGGPAHKDYQADWPPSGAGPRKDRFLPTGDFYRDWAEAEFGPEVAQEAGRIFAAIDCRLPEPSGWTDGPGGLGANKRPWDEVRPAYAFVADLEKLRPLVKGAGCLDRFDYWLGNFRYMMATEQLKCAWGKGDKDAMKAAYAEVYKCLLPTVTTPGELGTVANWEQHVLPSLKIDPAKTYEGPMRVIVPTVRTAVNAGETINLKVIILGASAPTEAAVRLRPLGAGAYTKVALAHVARGVYSARLTPPLNTDFEYYVEATVESGRPLRWPPTAPGMNQTVVVAPAPKP